MKRRHLFIAGALGALLVTTPAKASLKFVDVPQGHWAYDAIEYAERVGCWEGYPDGTFRGNRNITRYEMAMLIQRIVQKCVAIPAATALPIPKEIIKNVPMAEKDKAALAELDKVKVLVKKLEKEFQTELATLQAKEKKNEGEINKLWKDQERQDAELGKVKNMLGNVKISGNLRSRFDAYRSGVNARLAPTIPANDPVIGAASAAAAAAGTGLETETGYELVYGIQLDAEINPRTSIVVQFDNTADDLNYGSISGASRTPQLDEAYAKLALLPLKETKRSLTGTLGTQFFAFGPHHLLVDNDNASFPVLRLDYQQGPWMLTFLDGFTNQDVFGGVGAINPVNGGLGQDNYSALRLAYEKGNKSFAFNALPSGQGKEKAWGMDLKSDLFKKGHWITGLTGEAFFFEDDQSGKDPGCAGGLNCSAPLGSEDLETSYIGALEIYKSKRTYFNAYYADIGLTPGWTGAVSDPFTEAPTHNTATGHQSLGFQADPYRTDQEYWVAPDFEGYGFKISHAFSHGITVAAIGRKGDYNSVPNQKYPFFQAYRLQKSLGDDHFFALGYARYGADTAWLEQVRAELNVSF